MIKKILPAAALIVSGIFVYRYLRGKADAVKNLIYEPIKVTIDSPRSAASNFSRLYYTVTIRLVNNFPENVNVRSINLEATSNGNPLGNLTSTAQFVIPGMSNRTIQLTASIATAGLITTIINAIQDGFNIPVNISGFINTDLGKINVSFNKNIGF
jgi:hypothetical protein